MIQFDAAPPVPTNYPLLAALTVEEIDRARALGYVAEEVDVRKPVLRAGLNNDEDPPAREDLEDWRTRMYVIWFCYIYENFRIIHRPLFAIEELILEFKGLGMIDCYLASLYAGTGGAEPDSFAEREKQIECLKPYYIKAKSLLDE